MTRSRPGGYEGRKEKNEKSISRERDAETREHEGSGYMDTIRKSS